MTDQTPSPTLPRAYTGEGVRRRGTVIIVVMVVVFVLAAMVLTLGRQVQTEALASANALASQKADAAERGAEQFALSVLSDYKDSLADMTQDQFTAVPVGDSYFWIIRPDYGDATLPNWGLLDESTKMPLNDATQAMLAAMPGMTDDLAASIVAYHGTITQTTTDGSTSDTATDDSASSSSSSSSTDGSSSTSGTGTLTENSDGTIVKNAPFESVGELMLVEGMTHDLLYGPPGAALAADLAGGGSGTDDWYVSHGLSDYFTVWSGAKNVDPTGAARISYNDTTNTQAFTTLMTDTLGFTNARAGDIIQDISGSRRSPPTPSTDIFDFAQKAGLTADEIDQLQDYVTDNAQNTTIPGRINVNTAPRDILLTLPGLESSDVDNLLAARTDAVANNPNGIGWVNDTLKDKAVGLGQYICGHGTQYSADIVSVSGDGRGFRHVKVVVDTSVLPAKIVFRRDLTDKGWPLDPAILDQLKHGQPLTAGATAPLGTH